MNTNRAGSGWRVMRWIAAVVVVGAAVVGEVWVARQFFQGGSRVTNVNAFAAEQVAVGLRLASQ